MTKPNFEEKLNNRQKISTIKRNYQKTQGMIKLKGSLTFKEAIKNSKELPK